LSCPRSKRQTFCRMGVEPFHLLRLALRELSVRTVVRVLPQVDFDAISAVLAKSAENMGRKQVS
ncbi:MAG: hypothetical protein ACU0DU_04035, partial [Sagittula sp.]|uniref:hypothetical protein n=1 Tax=Sagittula sp. TaxID=2038081 RepID=UPI00405A2978